MNTKKEEPVNLIHPWYDIRSALPTALGTALIKMLESGLGGHDSDSIRKHGDALIEFGLADAEGKDPDPTAAEDALHWVADNLLTLWD